ncbi:hypothetical protein RIF29_41958 [Crotalaria pallida]|uniref:DCD domain-containing protein n=1 Tax=Crotalaria pallida TaxID=3830 RepID=A0AAN9HS46_CROPI
MCAARKTQTFYGNGPFPMTPNPVGGSLIGRNLGKYQLGGVIFGCKNSTIKECLSKNLFGLPAQYFSYVKDIDRGLPLFLFNFSDRKLHGIFEAAGKGQMYIDPYAWIADCSDSDRTQYPAQVQMRVRLQCLPLSEDIFGQVIADNYFTSNHFWFELDHRQTSKLMSLLASVAIASGTSVVPRCVTKKRTLSQSLPSHGTLKEVEAVKTREAEKKYFTQSSRRTNSNATTFIERDMQPTKTRTVVKEVKQDEKNLVYMKLKEFAFGRESQDLSLHDNVNGNPGENSMCTVEKGYLEIPTGLEKKEDSSTPPFEYQYTQARMIELMEEVEELMAFKKMQTQKNCHLEQKLMDATFEIQLLKDRCTMLESACDLPLARVEKKTIQPSDKLHLDGESRLAAMDLYCPSQNVIKSFKPMSAARLCTSSLQLNGEIYVFGGGNGHVRFETVESYSPICNKWTLCTSLNQKKGSLAEVSLNKKIFALGSSNEVACFFDAKMLNLDIKQWILIRSMIDERFALAAAELNGALYAATGGYYGIEYLQSDLGGFEESTMVPSIEVFDPRRCEAWLIGKQMNHPCGYFPANIVKYSIHVMKGMEEGEDIEDTFLQDK